VSNNMLLIKFSTTWVNNKRGDFNLPALFF